jgi:hypothetical protein
LYNSRQQAHLVAHVHFLPTRKPNKKMQKKMAAGTLINSINIKNCNFVLEIFKTLSYGKYNYLSQKCLAKDNAKIFTGRNV